SVGKLFEALKNKQRNHGKSHDFQIRNCQFHHFRGLIQMIQDRFCQQQKDEKNRSRGSTKHNSVAKNGTSPFDVRRSVSFCDQRRYGKTESNSNGQSNENQTITEGNSSEFRR